MKKELRTKYKEIRNNIQDKDKKNQKIVKLLNTIIDKYDKIMIYYPISSEPNILNIISKNKKWYLPYCTKDKIEIRRLQNLDDLIKDEMGISSSKYKTEDMIDVVIAPAIACNKEFFRLGYGGGYYDEFLKNYDGLKIVVIYEELLTEEKYEEEFDVPFDYIVTDKQILKKV